jgi:hypothetical protein
VTSIGSPDEGLMEVFINAGANAPAFDINQKITERICKRLIFITIRYVSRNTIRGRKILQITEGRYFQSAIIFKAYE